MAKIGEPLPPTIRPYRADAVPAPRGARPFELPPGFEAGTPVDLEIGCGAGFHPIRYARSHPSRFLIAIEHGAERFGRFESRLRGHPGIRNLLPVQAEAAAWITHCLRPASISRCFLLYPNPNPKSAAKRWFRMPFMGRLIETLRPGGELIVATNIESYADEAAECAGRFWGLELLRRAPIGRGAEEQGEAGELDDPFPRTHFEKKYLERGETCWDLRFRKPGREA